jgi:hypothetical protein
MSFNPINFSWLRLTNASPRRVGNVAMAVINALQDYEPEEQIAGLVCAFLIATQDLDMRFSEVAEVAKNIMFDAEGKRPEFKAVEAYMRGEW